jgi:hypothetical protein
MTRDRRKTTLIAAYVILFSVFSVPSWAFGVCVSGGDGNSRCVDDVGRAPRVPRVERQSPDSQPVTPYPAEPIKPTLPSPEELQKRAERTLDLKSLSSELAMFVQPNTEFRPELNGQIKQELQDGERQIDRLPKDLSEISQLKSECATLSNAEIMEDSTCRCLLHPTDLACRCRMNPKQPVCQVKKEVFETLPPRERGIWIENYVAETEYSESKGYSHVGKTYGGTMPYFDFSSSKEFLQLKTVDTAGASWPAPGSSWSSTMLTDRMLTTLERLAEHKLPYPDKNIILDIRTQPGGLKTKSAVAAANSLVARGKELGITVVIKEFR